MSDEPDFTVAAIVNAGRLSFKDRVRAAVEANAENVQRANDEEDEALTEVVTEFLHDKLELGWPEIAEIKYTYGIKDSNRRHIRWSIEKIYFEAYFSTKERAQLTVQASKVASQSAAYGTWKPIIDLVSLEPLL